MRGGERRVHRPLAIGRDQNEAARGRRRRRHRRHVEGDAGRAHVVRENLAELIIGDLPDKRALVTQRRQPRERVRGRTARDFACRTHAAIQRNRGIAVDQAHRAAFEAFAREKLEVGVGNHVDDGIADRDDVVGGLHESPFALSLSKGCPLLRSRQRGSAGV